MGSAGRQPWTLEPSRRSKRMRNQPDREGRCDEVKRVVPPLRTRRRSALRGLPRGYEASTKRASTSAATTVRRAPSRQESSNALPWAKEMATKNRPRLPIAIQKKGTAQPATASSLEFETGTDVSAIVPPGESLRWPTRSATCSPSSELSDVPVERHWRLSGWRPDHPRPSSCGTMPPDPCRETLRPRRCRTQGTLAKPPRRGWNRLGARPRTRPRYR